MIHLRMKIDVLSQMMAYPTNEILVDARLNTMEGTVTRPLGQMNIRLTGEAAKQLQLGKEFLVTITPDDTQAYVRPQDPTPIYAEGKE